MTRRSLVLTIFLSATLALTTLPLAAQQEVDVTGTWTLEMEGPQGMVNMTLELKQAGGAEFSTEFTAERVEKN